MQQHGSANPYEVYCYRCNVTAPKGQRRCVHCGGRLSAYRGAPPEDLPGPSLFGGAPGDEPAQGEPPRRAGGTPAMTLLWILLLVGGSLYRLCSS